MCGSELHSIRQVAQIFAMPWHAFNEGSGAWMLHPQDLHALDPVVLVDHFKMPTPTFPPHPHAGFSAVTYLFEDSEDGFNNRDSLGTSCRIEPGALHWTQAGRGMLHEEVPSTPGKVAHGLQLFINSRADDKNAAPAAFHMQASSMPVVKTETGVTVRLVQGEFSGQSSRVAAHTPVTLLDIQMPAGSCVDVPVTSGQRAVVIVVLGGLVTSEGAVAAHHALRYADHGAVVQLHAAASGAQVVLLAGAPIGESPLFRAAHSSRTRQNKRPTWCSVFAAAKWAHWNPVYCCEDLREPFDPYTFALLLFLINQPRSQHEQSRRRFSQWLWPHRPHGPGCGRRGGG
jgi:redox-sensitive bicupin YhaK (pirin superfamily)